MIDAAVNSIVEENEKRRMREQSEQVELSGLTSAEGTAAGDDRRGGELDRGGEREEADAGAVGAGGALGADISRRHRRGGRSGRGVQYPRRSQCSGKHRTACRFLVLTSVTAIVAAIA